MSGREVEIKAGDYVSVLHDCATEFGTVRHDTPVLVTHARPDAVIPHARGVRCDGSRIEWSFAEAVRDDSTPPAQTGSPS